MASIAKGIAARGPQRHHCSGACSASHHLNEQSVRCRGGQPSSKTSPGRGRPQAAEGRSGRRQIQALWAFKQGDRNSGLPQQQPYRSTPVPVFQGGFSFLPAADRPVHRRFPDSHPWIGDTPWACGSDLARQRPQTKSSGRPSTVTTTLRDSRGPFETRRRRCSCQPREAQLPSMQRNRFRMDPPRPALRLGPSTIAVLASLLPHTALGDLLAPEKSITSSLHALIPSSSWIIHGPLFAPWA